MTALSDVLGGGLPKAFSNLTAGEAIQQGDLICQGPDGLAYWGNDPALNADYMHPLVNLATKYGGLAAPAQSIVGAAGVASAILSNGNFVVVGTNGANLAATIYDAAGNVVVATTTLVAAGVVSSYLNPDSAPKVIALSGGGFAVSYCTAGGACLGIYSNALAVVGAPAQIIANMGLSALCQISNGNIVVVGGNYSASSSFAIYSATGASVVAATSTGIAAINTYSVTVSPCGAGFVVAAGINNSGTYESYWASFGATGTVITAATFLNSSTTTAIQYGVTSTGTPGGNAVLGSFGLNTNDSTLLMVLSTGAAAGTAKLGNAVPGQSYHFAMVMQGTSCLIVSIGNNGVYTGVLNNAMGWSSGPYQVSTSTASPRNMVAMAATSDGNYVVATNYGAMGRITPQGTIATTFGSGGLSSSYPGVAAIPTTPAILTNGPTPMSAADGPYWLAVIAGYLQVIYGTLGTRIPVGVASGAAASGGTVRFQVLGAAPLRLTFKKTYVANLNTTAIGYGQRMNVIGNLALLNGLQPQQYAPIPIN